MRAYLPDYELKTPANLNEALRLLANEPGVWQPFAGGTDLMVLLEAGKLAHKHFVSLWGLPELRGIEIGDDAVTIGAMTTYTQIQRHAVLREEFPMLCEAASLTGAVAIQNRGTIGGNIANASPAADSLPALLVYEAELELISTAGARRVAYRDFHTGYKTTVMREDELIRAVRLPRATAGWRQHLRKVGTRKAQAISKVCIAAMARLDGDIIREARIAYGSVAPVPVRVWNTEALLKDQKIDSATINAAQAELLKELKPIDDVRSSADYRLQVAANLLEAYLGRLKNE
ncbi:MAG TPA: xanthine dehydrogenase family protein subunit M [Blastocatellia bacterium]|nr:xanthine dehydrogenase family protein subunit M [Blastocatellia bacterium]HMV85507.1 xanthine dehydrogenase family protein subunit M [Blastocatellia bacterium]HMY70319.1 xanthine dehydrogenase family protein subunit M [Blastocatellia bacterium]HMZ19982.1 xanthine dehydrogenase family protein subunit M [Blastocatellia bacterium]HNG32326.1 xanthine dehydrogenase family protein subunit M [Blastocatellia bacterium]